MTGKQTILVLLGCAVAIIGSIMLSGCRHYYYVNEKRIDLKDYQKGDVIICPTDKEGQVLTIEVE